MKTKAILNNFIHNYLKVFSKIVTGTTLLIFVLGIRNSNGQTAPLVAGLDSLGFENIRALKEGNMYYVSIENNIYRWNPYGLVQALNNLATKIGASSELHLVLLKKGIPYCSITVNKDLWDEYGEGILDDKRFGNNLDIDWDTQKDWVKLKGINPVNKHTGKFDFVFYPQFAFENTRLAKIYETQLNLSPAIEFSLWRGNEIRGQVIFPIHNELGYEGNFIRPGFITIAQQIMLPGRWWGVISAGNFNSSRYGIEMFLWHPLKNDDWNLEFKTGLTGYSHFYDHKWINGSLSTITWSSALSWYYSHYNIVFKCGVAQYIYNDLGLFASCTRSFGETEVGFYVQYGEDLTNGGFNINIPFPFKKRLKNRRFRINIPNSYILNYNAGTELYYGQNFSSNPVGNQINFVTFTRKIKNNIIQLKNPNP